MFTRLIEIFTFLWAGMILGISFLESWAKFRAPNLTKPIGLDVGRTVFHFFHKAQCGLILAIVIFSFFVQFKSIHWLMITSLIIILVLQLFWLFPKLSRHVDIILSENSISDSFTHTAYGIFEASKFSILILLGTSLIT